MRSRAWRRRCKPKWRRASDSASIPAAQVRARLDAGSAQGLACDRTQVACLVQLGIVVRADRAILATLAKKEGQQEATLVLRLVDVLGAEQLARAAGSVAAEPTVLQMRALLARLDDPAAHATRVSVRGPAGAIVLLDGKALGKLPLPALNAVSPGKHVVTVLGPLRHDENIDVRRGEPVVVEVPVPASAPASAPGAPVASATPPSGTSGPDPATPVARADDPGVPANALPWLGVAGGGSAVILGAAGLLFGLSPRFAYDDAAAELRKIEAEVGTNHAALVARRADVEAARGRLDDSAAQWTTWGAPLAIAGGVALGAGLVVAGAGAFGLAE